MIDIIKENSMLLDKDEEIILNKLQINEDISFIDFYEIIIKFIFFDYLDIYKSNHKRIVNILI